MSKNTGTSAVLPKVESKTTPECYIRSGDSVMVFCDGKLKNARAINSALANILLPGFTAKPSLSNLAVLESAEFLRGMVAIDESHPATDIFGIVTPEGGNLEMTRQSLVDALEIASKHAELDALTESGFWKILESPKIESAGKDGKPVATSI